MCIRVDSPVLVPLNKKGLGIGYKIVEESYGRLRAPFYGSVYNRGKWAERDPVFRSFDSSANHGFHIYINQEDAEKTLKRLNNPSYQIWKVYFKNVLYTGYAVNIVSGVADFPCVVTQHILLKKRITEKKK